MRKSANPNYYSYLRNDIINIIPERKYINLLDVGCGEGYTAQYAKNKFNIPFVAGVEINETASKLANHKINKIYTGDIQILLETNTIKEKFDIILFADVIEHLINPWETLMKIKNILNDNSIIVASIPNLAYHSSLKKIILDRWIYTDSGILDITHLRFFTRSTIIDLFNRTGYSIKRIEVEKYPGIRKRIFNILTFNLLSHIFIGKYLIVAVNK